MAVACFLLLSALCLGYVQNEPIQIAHPAVVEDFAAGAGISRIVAGQPAADGQFPHQISIRMIAVDGRVVGCGGSVMHHSWILTAAHCLANFETFVVRLGLTHLTRPEWMVETTRKYIHPRYIEALAGVQTDDIALLGLDQVIPYGPTIQPIRLQNSEQKNDNYAGVVLTVSGFGLTDDPPVGRSSEILNWVYQRGITNLQCWYEYVFIVKQQTVCAQYYNHTSQSSCTGDSGGPVIFEDADGAPTQVGVVSFGSVTGCNNDRPSGYVRPGHYHDWFFDVTGINFDWKNADIQPKVDVEQPSIVESVNVKRIEINDEE